MPQFFRTVVSSRRTCAWLLALCCAGTLPALTPAAAEVGREAIENRAKKPGAPEGVDRWRAPSVDREQLLRDDAIDETHPEAVYRVGVPFSVDLTPASAGTWETLRNGASRWRLVVESPGALWLVLGMGQFELQPGAALRLYTPDRATELGPFTSADIRSHGELWSPPIGGDTVIVELDWPSSRTGETPALRLTQVSHGYKPLDGPFGLELLGESDTRDLGDSGSCNIDIVCPLGDDWRDEEQGVVHILRGGVSFCSGSLIATTARDCQPLVLTAAHCFVASDAPSLTFRFNYERPNCGSGTPSGIVSVTGGTFRARSAASDFYLVEMDSPPPAEADAYFNGWDRSGTPPTESWGIHHPRGDAKKISYNSDSLINGTNYGPDHWRVTEWEQGTTEPTSSGSAIFDQNSRIVGQLHGGTASCSSITWDEYGKVSSSWTGGGTAASRLSDWLDPAGTGEPFVDGLSYTACLTPQPRLSLGTVQVDDTQSGNGDGVIDVGERVQLAIEVGNQGGTLAATSVSGTLTSTDPNVTILSGTMPFPDIAQGGAEYGLGLFEIEVGPGFSCGDQFPLALNMVAAESPGSWDGSTSLSTGTANVNVAFEDTMESGANGWTTDQPTGSNAWTQSTAQSSSPSTSWFIADIASVSDGVLASPAFAVPSAAVLQFRQFVDSESTFDGGVLEISTDGGLNWVDLGSTITEGGYNSTISTQYSSPIGGRQAWSGTIGSGASFATVEVELGAYAGQTVQVRWRFATDSSVSANGWFVDDVVISETSYDCSTALARPGEVSAPGSVPFRINLNGAGSYDLSWTAPTSGGPVDSYRLYAQPLAGLSAPPSCVTDLGNGTTSNLGQLPDSSAFLVVAVNAAGEGSYGTNTAGERASASATCP